MHPSRSPVVIAVVSSLQQVTYPGFLVEDLRLFFTSAKPRFHGDSLANQGMVWKEIVYGLCSLLVIPQ